MTTQPESADNLRLRGAGGSDTDTGPVLVVAVGGVDPSGGAGVVRDLLTARTFGARVCVVPTAWTEQSSVTGVSSVEPRDPARLDEAVATAWRTAAGEGLPVAVKVGMLPDARAVGAIVAALNGDGTGASSGAFVGSVVLDPVLGASSGGALFRDPPAALLPLIARATLVTPNVPEVAALLGLSPRDVRSLDDVARAGRALLDAGARAVLVKGGHLPGGDEAGEAIDTLVTPTGTRLFAASRHPGPDVRGTGCALATAIAVGLGRGLTLESAIAGAKSWLRGALERAVARGGEWHID